MSYVARGDKEKDYDATGAPLKVHKIRITLTSSNVKSLEKCPGHIYKVSKICSYLIQSPETSSTGPRTSNSALRAPFAYPPRF
jgi:small subunit ribosomal protein S20e